MSWHKIGHDIKVLLYVNVEINVSYLIYHITSKSMLWPEKVSKGLGPIVHNGVKTYINFSSWCHKYIMTRQARQWRQSYIMTSKKIFNDVKSTPWCQKYIMTSKLHYDIQKNAMTSNSMSCHQKVCMMSKKMCHDVKSTLLHEKYVMT